MALRTCCCGCSVKTGALIVGYIYAVLSGVGLFICVLGMAVDGSLGQFEPDSEAPAHRNLLTVKKVLFQIYLVAIVLCLKTLLINGLMIHGINRTKPAYVLPWIIFFGAAMVIKSLLAVSAIGFAVNVPVSTWYMISSTSTLLFLIEMYVLVVVSSHYHRMRKSSLLDEEQMMM